MDSRIFYDSNLYVKSEDGDLLLLVIYVAYVIIACSEVRAIAKVKSELYSAVDMKDLGLLHYCLGVKVW